MIVRQNLEVEVSVLLAASVDVLTSFSYKMGPNPDQLGLVLIEHHGSIFAATSSFLPLNTYILSPVISFHFWVPFLRESELEDENPIFSVLLKIQHKTDTSFGVEELNGRKRKVNFREFNLVSKTKWEIKSRMICVHLLNNCVIDVKVSKVINSNKISDAQSECRPLCGMTENLKVAKLFNWHM